MSDELRSKIYDERAVILARPNVSLKSEANELILSFYLDDRKYAIEDKFIQEVISYQKITKLPKVSTLFKGIVYHAGILWPVLDSSLYFHDLVHEKYGYIIFLQYKEERLAILADDIIDQCLYDQKKISKSLKLKQCHGFDVIKCIYNNETAVLDVKKIFQSVNELELNIGRGLS